MATGMFSGGGAAFGVFPQMKPRRMFQDPEGSANVPLDVLRGRLAGLLGLAPDLLNFMGRSPIPTEMFGETQYEPAPQLPYGSEYYLQNLPLRPTARVGEVAGQAGAFVPLNPMPAARAVAAGARTLAPIAGRMTEGYLQRQGLMPNIVPSEPVGMLGSQIKPQAPVSPIGFYSAAEQAALALPRKSGTGDAFLNDLMKGQDVKKDELSWMGLDEYLKGKPNVTRQEVQDYIAGNRVDVQEVRLGDKEVKFPSTIGLMKREEVLNSYQPKLDALYAEDANYANLTPQRYEELSQEIRALERQRDIDADAAYVMPSFKPAPTKYESYQLPGGENYREILLTLPVDARATYNKIAKEEFSNAYADLTPSQQTQVQGMARGRAQQNYEGVYTSSHFKEPNILAHMRVNDRIDADGKKMLLIEEVQSDWHQAGREKGYQSANSVKAKQAFTDYSNELANKYNLNPEQNLSMYATMKGMKPEEVAKYDQLQSAWISTKEGVPDAPFKGTWHQLALKRALKYAADNGYDRVGLTTGSQQAERYKLSKQISEVHYSGTNFKAYDLDGNEVISRTGVKPEDIAGLIGKEPAKKLLEQPKQGTLQSLTGQNLDVGGEGMKKYYDEIYPAFFEKQGKKYNAKTGETTIGKKGTIEKSGTSYYQTPDTKATVRYIDISPEMRGGVKKGQPLFTAAPIGGIGLGAGTQDNEMPDAVRQYMANPMYSDPFADPIR
jgi:hypothetical protein